MTILNVVVCCNFSIFEFGMCLLRGSIFVGLRFCRVSAFLSLFDALPR